MKNLRSLLLLLCTICMVQNAFGQKLDLTWSNPIQVQRTKTGLFEKYAGANSKYYYGLFADLRTKGLLQLRFKQRKFKITAFDINTSKEVATVNVFGIKGGTEDKKAYDGLVYDEALIYDDIIYVFYTKETKEIEEVYVETFSPILQRLSAVKKVYGIANAKGKIERTGKAHFILSNTSISDKIVIGGTLPSEKGQNVKVEYRVLDKNLVFSDAKTVTLPFIRTS
jgi:hypothetical protein